MHEIHLLKDILNKVDSIAAINSAKKVSRLTIWLGAFSHISAEHLMEHFVEESRGRICEGAKVDVDVSKDTEHPQAQEIVLQSVDIETGASGSEIEVL